MDREEIAPFEISRFGAIQLGQYEFPIIPIWHACR
jgi:hypothetical protein